MLFKKGFGEWSFFSHQAKPCILCPLHTQLAMCAEITHTHTHTYKRTYTHILHTPFSCLRVANSCMTLMGALAVHRLCHRRSHSCARPRPFRPLGLQRAWLMNGEACVLTRWHAHTHTHALPLLFWHDPDDLRVDPLSNNPLLTACAQAYKTNANTLGECVCVFVC